jgi:hypothetical protein
MREVTPELVMHHLVRLLDAKSYEIFQPWELISAPVANSLSKAAQI